MVSGAKQWSFKLAAKNFRVLRWMRALTSNKGPILFFSRYDWILDCCGDAMKKLLCLASAFSKMKSWGEPVSFVLQGGASATKMSKKREKKMSPSSGAAVEPRLSSDGLRQVRSRREQRARLIVETSARDHPQLCRLADSLAAASPAEANGTAALWQRLQIFRSLAASVNCATATPIYPASSA